MSSTRVMTRSSSRASLKNDLPSSPPSPVKVLDSVRTPPSSPTKRAKRVGFLGGPEDDSRGPTSSPPDPSTRPKKSILKKTSFSSPIKKSSSYTKTKSPGAKLLSDIYSCSVDFNDYDNLDPVLEAACKALEKNDPTRHLEIYASVNSALRLKERAISTQILVQNGSRLCQYAKRDILKAEQSKNTLDVRIVVQIVKVVDYLLFIDDVARTLDIDLARWFVVHALEALENPKSSKSVVGSYLHLINFQRVPNIWTSDISSRLLDVIVQGTRFPSTGVVVEYLSVYRLLLHNSCSVMISRHGEWIPKLLHALMEPTPLIQTRAIKVLEYASIALSNSIPCAQFIVDYFKLPYNKFEGNLSARSDLAEDSSIEPPEVDAENKDTFAKVFFAFLDSQLSTGSNGKQLMSIWSSMFLLIQKLYSSERESKGSSDVLDRLFEMGEKALFSGYMSTRLAAVNNWNAVAYAWTVTPFCQLDQSQQSPLNKKLKLVLRPFQLLQRKGGVPEAIAKSITALLNNILYCCLRSQPNLHQNSAQLNIIWDSVISPISACYCNSEWSDMFFTTLLHLFSSSSGKTNFSVGDRSRILSSGDGVALEEIPSFSSRWIRANSERILSLFSSTIFPNLSRSKSQKVWDAFLASLKSITQREIKTSNETMKCVAAICNFIANCWEMESVELSYCAYLVRTSMESFGSMCFVDMLLVREGPKLVYDPKFAEKPSDQSNGIKSHSAIMHIWRMISVLPKYYAEGDDEMMKYYFKLSGEYLAYICEKLNAPKKNMTMLLFALKELNENNYRLWAPVASELATQIVNGASVGAADAHKVLSWIVSHEVEEEFAKEIGEVWTRLLLMSCDIAKDSTDPDADVNAIIRPLAAEVAAKDKLSPTSINFYSRAFLDACLQFESSLSRMALQRANRVEMQKDISTLVCSAVSKLHEVQRDVPAAKLIESVLNLMERSNDMEMRNLMSVGLTISITWLIEFPHVVFQHSSLKPLIELYVVSVDTFVGFFKRAQAAVGNPMTNGALLMQRSLLLSAGMRSSDERIVNATSGIWNRMIPDSEVQSWPNEIISSVQHLRSRGMNELILPPSLEDILKRSASAGGNLLNWSQMSESQSTAESTNQSIELGSSTVDKTKTPTRQTSTPALRRSSRRRRASAKAIQSAATDAIVTSTPRRITRSASTQEAEELRQKGSPVKRKGKASSKDKNSTPANKANDEDDISIIKNNQEIHQATPISKADGDTLPVNRTEECDAVIHSNNGFVLKEASETLSMPGHRNLRSSSASPSPAGPVSEGEDELDTRSSLGSLASRSWVEVFKKTFGLRSEEKNPRSSPQPEHRPVLQEIPSQAVLSQRDMKQMIEESDFGEGFRKRKRSSSVATKNGKRRRNESKDRGKREAENDASSLEAIEMAEMESEDRERERREDNYYRAIETTPEPEPQSAPVDTDKPKEQEPMPGQQPNNERLPSPSLAHLQNLLTSINWEDEKVCDDWTREQCYNLETQLVDTLFKLRQASMKK